MQKNITHWKCSKFCKSPLIRTCLKIWLKLVEKLFVMHLFRSSRSKAFCMIVVLKNFAEISLCRSTSIINVADFSPLTVLIIGAVTSVSFEICKNFSEQLFYRTVNYYFRFLLDWLFSFGFLRRCTIPWLQIYRRTKIIATRIQNAKTRTL